MRQRLLVSLAGIGPGAPLDAAVALADELDARRVPLTLLVGPRPHPEVAAWALARRRAGDAALLHGTGDAGHTARRHHGHGRMPAHEAGLRLAAALRTRDALGLPADGFAAPGWAASAGTRSALVAAPPAGVTLLLDAAGVHRLGADGVVTGSCRGPVTTADGPLPRAGRWGGVTRSRRRGAAELVHLTLEATAGRAGHAAGLDAVDRALDAGAVPAVPGGLVPGGRIPRRGTGHDPELWSITA